MSEPSFTPTFEHTNWIDNVDRIQAGGPKGFNVRFGAIESDLHQAASVVGEIDVALNQSGPGPTGDQVLTPGLDLVSMFGLASDGWTYDRNGVAHPENAHDGGGSAAMSLVFPAGIRLTSFRAVGTWAGGIARLVFQVMRGPLTDDNRSPEKLAEVSTDNGTIATSPFDATMPVDPAVAVVDLDSFRYYLTAGSQTILSTTANSLAAIQFVYTVS